MEDLLERDREVPALRACVAAVGGGFGRLVVVDGEAGLGKTRLLAAAAELARESGVRVLTARGTEMEADYAYGIVRQLLERAVAAAPAVLDGPAALAVAAIDPLADGTPDAAEADLSFARMRALHLVCARLAEQQPTLLLVDDAHWADPASLRFLAFAARRLGDLPLGLAVSTRPATDDQRAPLLEALLAEPDAVQMPLRALSRAGVARLVQQRRGQATDEAFAAACHDVTRGNPFLLSELLREADDLGLPATAAGAERVRTLGPESIARAVLGRLRRSGAATTDAARWFAVLGDGTTLELVAELAGLTPGAAREAVDALYEAGVLVGDDTGGLRFVHSVVRTAIYGDVRPAERARRHALAAALLGDRDASAERIAAHLLAGEPAGEAASVATLREAAARALGMGAPDAAVTYLRRALVEPPEGALRPVVLRDLARAEARVGDRATADHLLAAFGESPDVEFRVETAVEMAASLMAADRYATVAALVWELADELVTARPDLAIRIEAALLTTARFAPPFADVLERRGARIDRLLADERHAGTVAQRTLLAGLAFDGALRAHPADEVVTLAERALEGDVLPWDMSRSVAFGMAVHALALCDALASAERHLTWALDRCRPRGSASGLAWASFFRAFVRLRIGRLAEAEADALVAIETAEVAGLDSWMGAALAFLVEIHLERGDAAGAREAYERLVARTTSGDLPIVATSMLRGTGLMLLADGDAAQALACFEQLAELDASWGTTNSAGWTAWRTGAALAARALGDAEAATELAAAEVSQARAIGLSRGLARALRTRAAVTEDREGRLAWLEEALGVARTGPSSLELAHAAVDLGAAQRRDGRPAAARERLTEGYELAERCGARRLAAFARDELVAAGARPRRPSVTGRDALTPSEQRVARLAAAGRSNPQIAEELVVTRKTVEMHLGRVYRKLGIDSRSQLQAALESAVG